ncbi:MAG: hypothetical protein A2992_05435 [Elusimicrobia bacterium RIFCSPLOWO2_01_FULL_59_12]|nr:MAG: hypothetical protein A2992_05435 [Elusimicrobia bacterium RIFCSPLOWO2_01_FULL_59_12]
MKTLLILSHKAYDGGDVAWNALRLAETLIGTGHGVRIFLMNDAVDASRKQAKPENAEFDLGQMLLDLEKKGAEIKLCTTCINRCGIGKGDVLSQSWPATMKDLAAWTVDSERVITF